MEAFIKFIESEKFYLPIIYIALGFIIYFIIAMIINRISKIKVKGRKIVEKRKLTIISLIKNIIKYVIAILVVLAILSVYGVNTTSIIASLGIVGLVVGLAFQDIIKDFLAGIFIIFDNEYTVGDYVKINNFTGEVIELGLKTTKIKAGTGEIKIISNSTFTEVINYSQALSKITINIPVSYNTNLDKLEKIFEDLKPTLLKLENVRNDITILGLSSLDASGMTYSILIECLPMTQDSVKRQALRIIKEELDKNKVEIPYNKVDINIKGKM